MTKETLLKYNWFIDNEYLDQYIALVNNGLTEVVDGAERHHIIPAYWYKLKFPKLRIDYRTIANNDIDEELAILTKADHVKAHELLTHCTSGQLLDGMLAAYGYMLYSMYQPVDSKKLTKTKARAKHKMTAEEKAARAAERKKRNQLAMQLMKDNPVMTWEDSKIAADKILAS